MTRWQVLERPRVLAEVTEAIRVSAQGCGRVLVIEGHRGTGKSATLAQVAENAIAHGFKVARTRSRPESSMEPGAMLQELIGGSSSPSAVLRNGALASFLKRSAQRLEPLALLVDDVHFADAASLQLLAQLAREGDSRRLLIALALPAHRRPLQDPNVVEELRGLAHCVAVALRPLRKQEMKRVISQAMPGATAAFCDECATLSAGNPHLLRELITWIAAQELEPSAGSPAKALEPVPPPAMRHFVEEHFEELGPDATAVAVTLALSDAQAPSAANGLAGLPAERARRAISALRQAGLLQRGKPPALASEIVAHCLRAQASQHRGRVLVDFAKRELADGNPADAKLLIRRALAEGTPPAQSKSDLLVRLGHAELVDGDPGSTTSLASAAALTDRPRDRTEALVKLGVAQVAAGAPHHAAIAFDAARHAAPEDDGLQVQAAANSAIAELLVPEQSAAAYSRISELARSEEVTGQRHGPEVLLAYAWGQLCRGARRQEVASHVRTALSARSVATATADGYFHATAATMLTYIDDFREAERVTVQASSVARSAGSLLAERNLGIAQAVNYLHSGRLDKAAHSMQRLLAHEADTSKFPLAGAAAMLIEALLESDALAEAEAVLHRAETAPVTDVERVFRLQAATALYLALGRPAEALSAAQEAGHLAEAFGILNPTIVAWETRQALCYAASGDRERARELSHHAVQVAEGFGAPRALALTLRVRARVQSLPAAVRDLARAQSVIEGSDSLLERAKVQVAYGAALHELGDSDRGRKLLRRGIEIAQEVGALRTARAGLAALVAAGGRPRRARWRGVESLTPAERRVADLAGDGLSNREIAQRLVVTRKTVEWHLRNAFSKLGVRSRKDLPGALSGSPSASAGSPSR